MYEGRSVRGGHRSDIWSPGPRVQHVAVGLDVSRYTLILDEIIWSCIISTNKANY